MKFRLLSLLIYGKHNEISLFFLNFRPYEKEMSFVLLWEEDVDHV